MRLRRAASLFVIVAAFMLVEAGAASATARIDCVSSDKAAWISFLASSLSGLRPMDVDMTAGEKAWSTNNREKTTPISVSQAFQSDDRVTVDLTDDNMENVLAELRVYTAVEGSEDAAAGILKIVGVGVWAVTCTGM